MYRCLPVSMKSGIVLLVCIFEPKVSDLYIPFIYLFICLLYHHLTLFILMDYPIHIDTISIEFSVYFVF